MPFAEGTMETYAVASSISAMRSVRLLRRPSVPASSERAQYGRLSRARRARGPRLRRVPRTRTRSRGVAAVDLHVSVEEVGQDDRLGPPRIRPARERGRDV